MSTSCPLAQKREIQQHLHLLQRPDFAVGGVPDLLELLWGWGPKHEGRSRGCRVCDPDRHRCHFADASTTVFVAND